MNIWKDSKLCVLRSKYDWKPLGDNVVCEDKYNLCHFEFRPRNPLQFVPCHQIGTKKNLSLAEMSF